MEDIRQIKETIKANLATLHANIDALKERYKIEHEIDLVVVSKYMSDAALLALISLGERDFGENLVQNLARRSEAYSKDASRLARDRSETSETSKASSEDKEGDEGVRFHMIGNLQTNKINALLQAHPYLLHSLSSLRLAHKLETRLAREGLMLDALMQVKINEEDSKIGVLANSAIKTYKEIAATCPHIRLKGLMGVATHTSDTARIEEEFATIASIYYELRALGEERAQGAKSTRDTQSFERELIQPQATLTAPTILSLGMSSDYALAIKHGATMLRIGSLIFSER